MRPSRPCSPTSRGAWRWARRRARSRASGTGWPDIAARLEGIYERVVGSPEREGGRVTTLQALARNPWARGLFVLASLVAALLALWWRGPEWDTVYHAFDFVRWRWVVVGVVLNLLSVLARALSWNVTIHQALPPPLPAVPAGVLGLRRRPARERRPPGACGRAGPRRRAPPAPARPARDERDPARDGVLPPAVRPVPDRAARRLRRGDGEDAALGRDRARDPRAGRPRAPHRRDHRRPSRPRRRPARPARRSVRLLAMARQGLAVLRTPAAAVAAILLQTLGWVLQLLAVWAVDGGVRPRRPAPGGRARAPADERRDGLPALAGQRRPAPGGRRAAARRSTASRTARASPTGSCCRRSRCPSASASGS